MMSLSDAYEEINDDPDEHRSPPAAIDFTRITTRFMVGGRDWAHANRERALEALRGAVVAWNGFLYLTLWVWRGYNPRGGTAEKPGDGVEYRTTIDRYAKMLADNAKVVRPKGQLACVTLGRSRYRGSFDDECTARTGILFDSDGNGGWHGSRALSRSIGLAFVAQLRPAKPLNHHFEVPVATPWFPERDADGSVHGWKASVYCPQLGWILGIFSELADLRYDLGWDEAGHATAAHAGYDAATDRLLQLNYIYHVRPEDPPGHVPVTDFATGGALDVEALLAATDFEAARVQLDRSRQHAARVATTNVDVTRAGTAATPVPFFARRDVPGTEEIERRRISMIELLVRLRRLRNPESLALVNLLLDGRSYAPLRQRDTTMHRAASIIAALAPNEDPVELAKLLFTKSLTTMQKLPGADPVDTYVETYLALAAKKIARAQQRLGAGAR